MFKLIAAYRSHAGVTAGVLFVIGSNAEELVLKFPNNPDKEYQATSEMSVFGFVLRSVLVSRNSLEGDQILLMLQKMSVLDPMVINPHTRRFLDNVINNWDQLPDQLMIMERLEGVCLAEIDTPLFKNRPEWAEECVLSGTFLHALGSAFVGDGFIKNRDRFSYWGDRNQGNILVNDYNEIVLIDQEFGSADNKNTQEFEQFLNHIQILNSDVLGIEHLYFAASMIHRNYHLKFTEDHIASLMEGMIYAAEKIRGSEALSWAKANLGSHLPELLQKFKDALD